ncbi:very-long-chain (3R)-3-hydroxyacyl-CoA dehydratase [Culicoides brevitarsis]|uniref:very-long-chain (3R)-3-hydroxyacyl-CoA dehydratase n=1 Tax=Culicoides brevitarsis TaxID=469753 RepID=UPI00307C45F7
MPDQLSPFVYWAQTETHLSLKVDLKDVKTNPFVSLRKDQLAFAGHGHGAKGVHDYKFHLDFFNDIDAEKSSYKVVDSKIDFSLKKQVDGWWPRLIAQPQKPSWLKIDFDKWKSEDDGDDEEEERDVMRDYPGMYDQVSKEELGYRKEKAKKVYLILYNLLMWIGYMYIVIVMGIRYYAYGEASMPETYEALGPAFKFCQLLQYLEVMHPMFGYVKGGVLMPFIQVSGRAFVLFCMIEMEQRMWTKPVVFYIFVIWASVETVRYPYYLSQLFELEIGILTWLRYTMWIPLYPLGILCEGVIILRNIPYFEETKRLTVEMPNAWNVTFDMPTFMKIYLLVLAVPGTYMMMSHMAKTRAKKLGSERWKKYD